MGTRGDGSTPAGGKAAAGSLVALICESCVRLLPVSGVAVSMMTADGHVGVVFATDDISRALEDHQFTLGTGPGIDSFATGAAQFVPDIGRDDGTRSEWTAFQAAAADLGVRAVYAFPLRLGAASLGVLTMYRRDTGPLEGADLVRAVHLTNAAAAALLDLMVDIPTETAVISEDGSPAGPSSEFYRVEIYQAAGMIKIQLGVTIEVAMLRLRAFAFAAGRSTGEVAQDVVDRKLRFEPDTV